MKTIIESPFGVLRVRRINPLDGAACKLCCLCERFPGCMIEVCSQFDTSEKHAYFVNEEEEAHHEK